MKFQRGLRQLKICLTCGKEFEVIPSQKHRRYCCFECSVKNRTRVNWHKFDIRLCPQCHNNFKIISWRKTRFCSHKCSTDFNRNKPNGRGKAEKKSLQPHCHRYVDSDGRKVLNHRRVVEERIGRRLTSNETVHHINLDKTNISDDNLYLFQTEQEHQIAHRSIDALIKPLMELKVIEFKEGRYAVAVTFADTRPKGGTDGR